MNRSLYLFPLLLLAALPCRMAHGEPTRQGAIQSPQSIRDSVLAFLRGQQTSATASVQIHVDTPDPRLRLPLCDRPLEAELPPAGRPTGRVAVGVRCNGRSPWTLYVPALVQLFDRVVVSRRTLARGTPIQPGDLRLERRDLTRELNGYFLRLADVVGQAPSRTILPGRVLAPGLVQRPPAVTRGALVSIVAQLGGVEARMRGRALEPGALGARIRVETLSGGKELQARVVSAGTVKVDI
jgi:flagella basal body P-ring formation protein FlgA